MAHNNKPDPNLIKKLLQYYDVAPQPEFMPTLKSDLMDRFSNSKRTLNHNRRRLALALVATFAAVIIAFFSTPIYEVLGQIFVELIPQTESHVRPNYGWETAVAKTAMAELNPSKTPEPSEINATSTPIIIWPTESDLRPNHGWQTEPIGGPAGPTRTPNPGSMQDSHWSIEKFEKLAGWEVLVPTFLPERAVFYGANYDPETNIFYLFYRGDILIRQEQITSMDDCDLCTEVGSNADPIPVLIDGIPGEFVVGVWKLQEGGIYWKNDPSLIRLRWESNSTVYEIMMMNYRHKDAIDVLIEIADSFE